MHGVATPPLLPALTVSSREVPLLGFRLLWRSSEATVVLATIVAPILLLALRIAAVVAVFSPVSRFSR